MGKVFRSVALVVAIGFFSFPSSICGAYYLVLLAFGKLANPWFERHALLQGEVLIASFITLLAGPYLCLFVVILAVVLLRDTELSGGVKTAGSILTALCVFGTAVVIWQNSAGR
jgi:hypothetical protein